MKRAVAARWCRCARRARALRRIGGDRFGVLAAPAAPRCRCRTRATRDCAGGAWPNANRIALRASPRRRVRAVSGRARLMNGESLCARTARAASCGRGGCCGTGLEYGSGAGSRVARRPDREARRSADRRSDPGRWRKRDGRSAQRAAARTRSPPRAECDRWLRSACAAIARHPVGAAAVFEHAQGYGGQPARAHIAPATGGTGGMRFGANRARCACSGSSPDRGLGREWARTGLPWHR